MDLYKNWNTYSKEYNINKFYDVDKKQFLRELTNFIYSFAKYFNTVEVINKLEKSVNNLQQVNLVNQNWKLIDSSLNNIKKEFEKHNDKWYFIIRKRGNSSHWIWQSLFFKYDESAPRMTGAWLSSIKSIYRWDNTNKPKKLEFNESTGYVIFWTNNEYQNTRSFLLKYIDVIIQENIRVQQGGNPDYESPIVGTQRIIFDFEIVDESERYTAMYFIKKSIYRMILTIDNNNIIAGSLELTHNKTTSNDPSYFYKEIKLGFLFSFMKEKDNIFNFDGNTNSYLENGNIKYYEKMKGQIDINKFLKAFFAYALVPVFQNRSNFIESGYIDNLQYDTVLINFFGLKLVNFRDVLIDENNINKNKFEKLLNSMFTVSQNFYKDYLRTIFDLENNTYTQGYNKKYGLLANNGFKIYPRYFYFSDKYKSLDFKMYSAYKNRFYNTNYGNVFNYDFSVANNYNINQNEGYVFEGTLKNKYGLKYKKMEEQKIGYNVFELQAQKENDMYRYYDFNFGIYNWQEINNGGLFPIVNDDKLNMKVVVDII